MTAAPISSDSAGLLVTNPTDPHPTRIRAVIADSSSTFCTVIGALLKLEDRIEIVGRVSDGQEAIEAVTVLQPDLLLLDVEMPYIDGITTASILSFQYPALNIVLMSERNSSRLRAQVHVSSAQFFIYKPKFTEEFAWVLSKIDSASGAGRVK
jgi:CheY-like chemotaxis protein